MRTITIRFQILKWELPVDASSHQVAAYDRGLNPWTSLTLVAFRNNGL